MSSTTSDPVLKPVGHKSVPTYSLFPAKEPNSRTDILDVHGLDFPLQALGPPIIKPTRPESPLTRLHKRHSSREAATEIIIRQNSKRKPVAPKLQTSSLYSQPNRNLDSSSSQPLSRRSESARSDKKVAATPPPAYEGPKPAISVRDAKWMRQALKTSQAVFEVSGTHPDSKKLRHGKKQQIAKITPPLQIKGLDQNYQPTKEVESTFEDHPPDLSTPQPTTTKQSFSTHRFDHISLDLVKHPSILQVFSDPLKLYPTRYANNPDDSLLSRTNIYLTRSICICDPNLPAQPIQYRSKRFSLGPRGFSVGACGFLNLPSNPRERAPVLLLRPRPGPDNRPTFVLEYAAWLFAKQSGRPAFALACHVDVTEVMRKLTYRLLAEEEHQNPPKRETIKLDAADSKRSVEIEDSGLDTYLSMTQAADGDEDLDLSPLLSPYSDDSPNSPIDWLTLDCFPETPRQDPGLPAPVIGPLQSLLHRALMQYRDAFILKPSSTQSNTSSSGDAGWQLEYASQSMHSWPLSLSTALSKNEPNVLMALGRRLARGDEIRMSVKWGMEGQGKVLSAVPMVRGDAVGCWVCFLLDEEVGKC